MTQPTQIGKYEVLEQIGIGGFSAVYKGRDPFIERLVAIKICLADEEGYRERFFREARIGGNLDHPNIVTVFDFGIEEQRPYLVQEYLTGHDLGKTISTAKPLPTFEKLEYLMRVAKGLQYAHSKGVLHRDIKPTNIRVLANGDVKIMDFGIATLKSSHTRLTSAGNVVGTAGYLAPEQISGGEPDESADIFSYGVVAYELMAYQKPFPGEDIQTVFEQILRQPPQPLRNVWDECPDDLETLLEQCLAKAPGDRPSSFSEIIPRLNAVLVRTRPERRTTARSATAGAAGKRQEQPPAVGLASQERGPASPGHTDSGRALRQETAPPEPVPRSLRGRSRLSLLAGAVVCVAIVFLGIWLLLSRARPIGMAETTTDSGGYRTWQAEPLGPYPAAGAQGMLVIDALPWGEIAQVIDNDGDSMAVADDRSTPATLRLDPGLYRVVLASPASQEKLACEVIVAAGQQYRCLIPFSQVNPTDYFRKLGWWK